MKILIEKEKKTPEVKYDKSKKELLIEGILIPENPEIFFDKFNQLVFSSYMLEEKLIINFYLEYFNTGAARFMYKLLLKLKNKENIEIIWKYEVGDEDILESGQEFEKLTGLPFIFEEV